jgi:hypothetical protein
MKDSRFYSMISTSGVKSPYLKALSTHVDGESNQRFCQKCTRFHGVAMFKGVHRTCRAQVFKRQQTAKRLRKLKEDEGNPDTEVAEGSEGANSTQMDTKQDAQSAKASKRRRTAEATAHSLDFRADAPPVHGAGFAPAHGGAAYPGYRNQRAAVTSLVDEMVGDVFDTTAERDWFNGINHHNQQQQQQQQQQHSFDYGDDIAGGGSFDVDDNSHYYEQFMMREPSIDELDVEVDAHGRRFPDHHGPTDHHSSPQEHPVGLHKFHSVYP